MQKRKQKIVLFTEPKENQYSTPLKIRNLFMNRFAIEEDDSNEILKIYQLENTFGDFIENRLSNEKGLIRIKFRGDSMKKINILEIFE